MNNSNTSTPILDDDAITEIEARPYIVVGWGRRIELRPEERDALCATVRALRAENERLTRERNDVLQFFGASLERNGDLVIDMKKYRYNHELKAVDEFRASVVRLISDRATEWERDAGSTNHSPDGYNYSLCKRDAVTELAQLLEQLK